jgi:hypothetical protein
VSKPVLSDYKDFENPVCPVLRVSENPLCPFYRVQFKKSLEKFVEKKC